MAILLRVTSNNVDYGFEFNTLTELRHAAHGAWDFCEGVATPQSGKQGPFVGHWFDGNFDCCDVTFWKRKGDMRKHAKSQNYQMRDVKWLLTFS